MTSQFFAMVAGMCMACILWAVDTEAPYIVILLFAGLSAYCLWSSVHFARRKL